MLCCQPFSPMVLSREQACSYVGFKMMASGTTKLESDGGGTAESERCPRFTDSKPTVVGRSGCTYYKSKVTRSEERIPGF
ncbi:hypothetical protein DL546_004813 [Coniochaeta pulveracea]|uniref:Uncharacterized protein n=1 Tax=Coniochaeta pulveracea TaxID=177199 RepID=A0A420Y5F1_9PEZI|nr:hypothetical protein DL546_004813 [Coniochaeta pulveracea]